MKAALLAEYHRPLELVERPEPEPKGPRDVVVRVGGAGVCATDLHAIDGLMEPAGLRPPVVLGHENAGWVHAVGDDVTAAAVGDAVLALPAVQLRALRAVPARPRHALRAARVHGAHARRRLRRLRARRRAVARPAAGRRRARGRGAARGCRDHRLPRGEEARPAPRSGHDRRGDRRRRRRSHRPAAPARPGRAARSSRSTPTSGAGGSRASSAPTRCSASRTTSRARCGSSTDGAGADVVLDFVGTDETHAAGLGCWRGAASTRSSATAARSRFRRSLLVADDGRSRATSSAAGSTSGSSCSCTRAARSRCAPRRTRSTT